MAVGWRRRGSQRYALKCTTLTFCYAGRLGLVHVTAPQSHDHFKYPWDFLGHDKTSFCRQIPRQTLSRATRNAVGAKRGAATQPAPARA